MAIILLLTLVGLMVGQNKVLSCDPSTLAKSNFTSVNVKGSLVRDGEIYEIELAKQIQSVECQAQGATNVTLSCDSATPVTENGSSVVKQFTLVNGTRCDCSAQHTTLCFKKSTFTVQTKYLNFTTNGLTNGSANVFAGQSVVLECTVVSRVSYNMTISDNKNATLSSGKNTDRIVYNNLMAPAQPAVYFCSATSSEGTLTQSLQLDIKSNFNGASRFFNPDFMVFFSIAAILVSYC